MAMIGAFKVSKAGGWEGEIKTLSLNAKVRFEPNDNRTHPNSPHYRVMAGGFHAGDAWRRQSRAEPPKPYYRVSLDDPRFDAPICAMLFPDGEGLNAQLVWTRPAKPRGGQSPSGPSAAGDDQGADAERTPAAP